MLFCVVRHQVVFKMLNSEVFLLLPILIGVLTVSLASTTTSCTGPVKISEHALIVGVEYPNYQSFLGIPYARAPINGLRFAVSVIE